MGIVVLAGSNSPGLTVGGVDLSDHVQQIEVQMNTDAVDVSAMGATSHVWAGGLRDDRMIVTFFQDFAASKVDATLSAINTQTGSTIIAYATGTTATSTSPKWSFVAAQFTYSPLNGAVGAASQTQVTFQPVAGSSITRGTS